MKSYYRNTKEQFYDLISSVNEAECGVEWTNASKEEKRKANTNQLYLVGILTFLGIAAIGCLMALFILLSNELLTAAEKPKVVCFVIVPLGSCVMVGFFLLVKQQVDALFQIEVWKKTGFFVVAPRHTRGYVDYYGWYEANGEIIIGFSGEEGVLDYKLLKKAKPGDRIAIFKTAKNMYCIDWDTKRESVLYGEQISHKHWELVFEKSFILDNDHRRLEIYEAQQEGKPVFVAEIRRLDCVDNMSVRNGSRYFVERKVPLKAFSEKLVDLIEKDMEKETL